MTEYNIQAQWVRQIENLGASPCVVVLDERRSDVQPIPMDSTGMPAQDPAAIASAELAITESLERLRCEALRHVGDGLLEARVNAMGEDGKAVQMLHFFAVGSIRRIYTRSNLPVGL